MALGVPTISIHGRGASRITRGRGMKCLTGDVFLSANSHFVTCGFEKYFRHRMTDLKIAARSLAQLVYIRSAQHKAGHLWVFGTSATSAVSTVRHMEIAAGGVSATFVAFGT